VSAFPTVASRRELAAGTSLPLVNPEILAQGTETVVVKRDHALGLVSFRTKRTTPIEFEITTAQFKSIVAVPQSDTILALGAGRQLFEIDKEHRIREVPFREQVSVYRAGDDSSTLDRIPDRNGVLLRTP